MIITLIFVGILVTGIACLIIYSNTDCGDWLAGVGIGSIIASIIAIIFISICIIDVQVNRDISYQNKLYEREMLEYRVNNMEDNVVGNEMLYNDIVEFNNELRSIKKWANSPWTNWFNNQMIASMDYIEINND